MFSVYTSYEASAIVNLQPHFYADFSYVYSLPCPLIKIQACEAPNFVIIHTPKFPCWNIHTILHK